MASQKIFMKKQREHDLLIGRKTRYSDYIKEIKEKTGKDLLKDYNYDSGLDVIDNLRGLPSSKRPF